MYIIQIPADDGREKAVNIAPAKARDENLIFEYERLRTVALTSGTACGLEPGERLLLSDGLHYWAIGWKAS